MGKRPRTKTGQTLYMSDDELIISYRQARDPIGQVRVLAELNAMEEHEMRNHLIDIGAIKPTRRKSAKKQYEKHVQHVAGNKF